MLYQFVKRIFPLLMFCLACLVSLDTPASIFHLEQGDPSHHFSSYGYTPNAWDRLTNNFKLEHYAEQPSVQKQIRWYQSHQSHLRRIAKRAAPYMYYILQEIEAHQMPGEIALLPILESAFDPFAYSEVGAAGLWQLMPRTARVIGLKQNWWYDGRRDIFASTNAALNYLKKLNNQFDHDWLLTLAAYDSGWGRVRRAMRRNAKKNKPTDFWSLNLPGETKIYLPRMLALAIIIKDPEQYGITLPAIKNQPYLVEVDTGSQIELSHAAKLADMTLDELYQLNPAFNRWATDPEGPHRLLLPTEKVETFKTALANVPTDQRVTWRKYTVKSGDNLEMIAKKFKTTVSILNTVNHLEHNKIFAGKDLLIPMETTTLADYILRAKEKYFNLYLKHLGPQKFTYKVKSGDTLSNIAVHYHVTVSQIRKWNHLKNNDYVRSGKKLTIWSEAKTRSFRRHKKKYRIRNGESLSVIAARFHVTTKALKEANHLKSDKIRVGEKLIIPS